MACSEPGNLPQVSNMAVLPQCRRKGLASALLHACEVLGGWRLRWR